MIYYGIAGNGWTEPPQFVLTANWGGSNFLKGRASVFAVWGTVLSCLTGLVQLILRTNLPAG